MSSKIFGIHVVQTVLDKNPDEITGLCLQDNYEKNRKLTAIAKQAKRLDINVTVLGRKQLDEYVPNANHQGVVAFVDETRASLVENDLDSILDNVSGSPLILILDQIQDPHNLGACLRTAKAAGVNVVIAPKDSSVSITPVVKKVACGAAETLPYIQVTNLARTMKKLQDLGIWITGTSLETEKTLYDVDYKGATAFVVGSEGKGMRRLVREHCDYLVKIPMPGDMESLNASVAAGVCLFEVVRQRM
ncbi:MAG: 23S rRNA (guanosine(2251)-2'-O)-methyltransferase RlmB [Gammaproteobacteria bacterium]|nr:23S rRNA (guanosine(2251)-2'-O)-methyltransferase RlmB [Gammaproteobacteria bacterium]